MILSIPEQLQEALLALEQIEWNWSDPKPVKAYESDADVMARERQLTDLLRGKPGEQSAGVREGNRRTRARKTKKTPEPCDGSEAHDDDRPDSEDHEWEKHLLDHCNYHNVNSLSDAEEESLRSQWLRNRSVYRHLDKFNRLTHASFGFFYELTKAGGQRILGERARFQSLLPSQQPHSLVHFDVVTMPKDPPLGIWQYEEEVGGPHVLGARLIWWCAAARYPKLFNLTQGFYLRLWGEPIWAVADRNGTRANPEPVELIKDAARRVCQLLANGDERTDADDPVVDVPVHGFHEDLFYWDRRQIHLVDTTERLVKYATRDHPQCFDHPKVVRLEKQEIKQKVYGSAETPDGTLTSQFTRTNRELKKHGIPWKFTSKKKYVAFHLVEMASCERPAE